MFETMVIPMGMAGMTRRPRRFSSVEPRMTKTRRKVMRPSITAPCHVSMEWCRSRGLMVELRFVGSVLKWKMYALTMK